MRILLVGYETECCSLAYLAELLDGDGHETLLAAGDYYHFIDDLGIKKFYDERGFTNWVNFETQYKRLYEDDWEVDWGYLQQFEHQYCETKNLQQLMRTDPILLRDHHFRRPYYTPLKSGEQLYYWTELLIRWTSKILGGFDPDIVYTYGRNYFVKNIVAQMALATGLPIYTLLPSRIEDYCHLSPEFGLGTAPDIDSVLRSDDIDTSDARKFISSYQSAPDEGGLYDEPAQRLVADDSLYTVSEILRVWGGNMTNIFEKMLLRRKRKYRGLLFAKNHFNSHFPSVLNFQTRVAFNRLKYRFANPFERTIPEPPFVYAPLHTLPESSTLTLSTEYYEVDLIRYMAKELPAGMDLVVKENPNMVGTRPFTYYDRIKNLPNVHLLDPMVQSKRLIRESRGVTSISGTALLEAAMLDTPTHYFGCPEFASVLGYQGRSEFGSFVDRCLAGKGAKHPERVERYVQYVMNEGRSIPLKAIRGSPRTDPWRLGTETVHEMLTATLEGDERL